MDNLKVQQTNEVKTTITENGHEALFHPPYSPQLNPIEEVFSKWKRLIKTENCENPEII